MASRRATPASHGKGKTQADTRRPDPFAAVTTELREGFEAEPWYPSRELLEQLRAQRLDVYPDGRLRTLQRRLKEWRREAAQGGWYRIHDCRTWRYEQPCGLAAAPNRRIPNLRHPREGNTRCGRAVLNSTSAILLT
jgi:hypothetical protein